MCVRVRGSECVAPSCKECCDMNAVELHLQSNLWVYTYGIWARADREGRMMKLSLSLRKEELEHVASSVGTMVWTCGPKPRPVHLGIPTMTTAE